MSTDQSYATGSIVRVRDEDWLVTDVEETKRDGLALTCTGASALVEGETAVFLTDLDRPTVLRPEDTRFTDDDSSYFTEARLYLEAVMRRAPLPRSEKGLALADRFLLDALDYQQRPAQMALSNLRPRLLIADVVGLGKTLEIGLLLAELIRRGRGGRILVVVPQQILDQFQRELWTRFSIPLLRMDTDGIARVQQQLPAGRNPFEFHQRIIISVDTLKSDRYRRHLEKVSWDAVVFDESHNLIGGTGGNSLRKQLARLVATTTEALVFASATPHPGKDRAFADLIDMLDPTRIVDRDHITPESISDLVIRRTKVDPEVSQALSRRSGTTWAKRGSAIGIEVAATEAEEAVFAELTASWLQPEQVRKADSHLFSYTLLKSFFSSPHALAATVKERQNKAKPEETQKLRRLAELNDKVTAPAKLAALLDHLRVIGIGKKSDERVVIFSERHQTLDWLQAEIRAAFGMDPGLDKDANTGQVRTLRGTTPDKEATEIVEAFGLGGSDLRVLVTGDIASEGVNLHRQCHQLVHWDLPWSLIRIEQRNGRIDRYGQSRSPEFAAFMLRSADSPNIDESRVAKALVRKEESAVSTLGSVGAALGHNNAEVDEDRLVRVLLAERQDPETAVETPPPPAFDLGNLLMADFNPVAETPPPARATLPSLFGDTAAFVQAALATPAVRKDLGVALTDDGDTLLTDLPDDLLQRITRILPPRYVRDQELTRRMFLTSDKKRAQASLDRAADKGTSAWPDLSFLSDLHPVVDWLTDRAILSMGRDRAPIVYADVPGPVWCIQGLYSNTISQSAVVEWMAVYRDEHGHFQTDDLVAVLHNHGVNERLQNRRRTTDAETLDLLRAGLPEALEAARTHLDVARDAWRRDLKDEITKGENRVTQWEAGVIAGLEELIARRKRDEEKARDTAQAQRGTLQALDVKGEPVFRVVAALLPAQSA
ncbi:helicase-related protein [Glycomyces dulcitolivorans]|uniref:helicase-related protein n=1 Tax=Glycomyces dulcitolivorans TaxID=2200759 RepID=UPI000DD3D05B|nr:DEAD/DEAH box helicase [Glycomyces dulcitolivorans]